MTRERKKVPAPALGVQAAARRAKMERALQYDDSVWRHLNPLKAAPKMKHKSYFEAVDNADKKKKLEFEVTTAPDPPPGYEFIPVGHPELSQECKELSREDNAMFFIVSMSKDTLKLDHHMNRLGYHFRRNVVHAARYALHQRGYVHEPAYEHDPGIPEPIPNSQWEIDQEADAVLRDLFPRIPHTDRQEIINHAFKKDGTYNGDYKVGMARELTLARRVQLAALAHIRHTHTRYDALLKESDWANARKAVEKPCLDIIVKWRGDEETGRDQLDEILREVIEISDTENDESEDESSSADNVRIPVSQAEQAAVSMPDRAVLQLSHAPNSQSGTNSRPSSPVIANSQRLSRQHGTTRAERRTARTARRTQLRFKRYAAAAEALASSNQNSHPEGHSTPGFVATPLEVVRTNPVNIYRATPSVVAQDLYTPRNPYGNAEIQKIPMSHSNGLIEDRVVGMSHTSIDARIHGTTEQFIRIPDAQRPKVGPYSAKYGQPSSLPLLSPVRQGLQDMVLPSIEPRSPEGPRVMHNVSQRSHREPQQSTEVPSVISRTVLEPIGPGSYTRSPATLANDNELAAKRRRVTTYFHEDYHRDSNPPYVRVAPSNQGDDLRRPQLQYLSDRRTLISRVPERVVYEDGPWPPSGQEVRVLRSEDCSDRSRVHPIFVSGDGPSLTRSRVPDGAAYQGSFRVATRQEFPVESADAPIRSRGNPIMIDEEGGYEPRRVVEVRGSPARGIYRTISPKGPVHSLHVQEDPRLRDPSSVNYVDESSDRLRREPNNRHFVTSQPQFGLPTYQEMPRQSSPNTSRQYPTFERSRRYSVDREVSRVSGPERIAPTQSNLTSRMIQAPVSEAPRLESFSSSQQYSYQSRPSGPYFSTVQQAVPQDTGGDVTYREVRPGVTRPADAENDRGIQQPFPVFPAPSSYAEIRGPPAYRRLRDYRDIIYVE
ncbi:hypothetical protein GGS21DRAFT_157814 [Xylaria nigripes]|nr:hypothetical protein GGS21DRAFT_157814 [Xylaria nigripes]